MTLNALPNFAVPRPRCTSSDLVAQTNGVLMLAPLLVAAAGLVLQPAPIMRARGASMVVVDMPEQLSDWECDATLWNRLPPGARRDLTRFALSGKEELARRRITTMREIAGIAQELEPSDTWEKDSWYKAVTTWEENEAAKEAAAKAAAKAAKQAKAKAEREAKAAAAAAAKEAEDK